jgi:quercetin dioxygenase-like cupin family protein
MLREGIPGKRDLIQLKDVPWEPFGGQTKGIFRKGLSNEIFSSGFKASLTVAKPGGEFPEHIDPYSHIFFVLEGKGEAVVEGQTIPLKKGTALTVAAGEKHGYKNAGPKDLLLITLNIYS